MHHLSLRAVQQSLASRGIRLARDGSNPDGSQRFAIWRIGRPRHERKTATDLDTGYIIGLRMA